MKKLAAVPLASLLVCAFALADTVDNPGPFTETFDAGTLKIGRLDPLMISGLQVTGDVDSNGNVTIPVEAVVLPDVIVSTPIGDVLVRFTPLADVTGTLDPVAGLATATLSIRIGLIDPPLLPDGCGIGPVDQGGIQIALTTDSDGDYTGVPYSMDDGTATYVNGTFTVPASDGCGFFGGLIDGQIGLPTNPGESYIDGLLGTFDPIFTGS